jgi:hypothetical protein
MLRRVLSGGALAFAVWGIAAPRSLARWLRADDPEVARAIGVREPGNVLVFAAGANRAALAQRMVFDVSDALVYGRRKPALGAGALAFAALGAVALARER